MIKHRRGPWRWVDGDGSDMGRIVDAEEKHICDFGNCEHYYPTEGTEPDNAEKMLMVAAPEMFECIDALETLFAPLAKDSTQQVWIDKARELKARLS